MSRLKLFKNSKGDTIVEVLISIGIISLVLTISYALANRNSAYIRQSQERGEAQKLSERQLEMLRNYLTPETPWETDFRCFDNNGHPTDTGCNGISGLYNITIAVDPDDANTYTVTTQWDPLTGNAVQNLELSYKLPLTGPYGGGPLAACNDGIDNDSDGAVDLGDPGCSSVSDNDETNPPVNYTLTVTNPGAGGRVSGPGINCGQGSNDCTETYIQGTAVGLSQSTAANYVFTGWDPASCGTTFGMSSNKTCTANFVNVPRTPLYRCFTSSDFNHYYTPHSWLCYPGIQSIDPNRYYEGIVGYVPTGGPYPSLYVYGGYNASYGDSFYTTNYNEYVDHHYAGWWNNTGYQDFSLYPSNCSVPGTVPLYRFWHAGVGDHLYTTNWWEGASNGFHYDWIEGCLFTSP